MDAKLLQFKESADAQRGFLGDLLEDLEVLKELFEEFDGYTSDA